MTEASGNGWRMILGDSFELLAKESPEGDAPMFDHTLTDPPYTEAVSDGARTTKAGHEGRIIDFGGIDGREASLARAMLRCSRQWVLAFCAFDQLGAYKRGAGDMWRQSGVWKKTNPMPQLTGDRPSVCGEAIAIMNAARKSAWNGGGMPAFWEFGHERERYEHPTPKPIPLLVKLLEQFTSSGDTIFDPFAGSGSTLIAGMRTGRHVTGIEINPKYFQLAVDRCRAEEHGLRLRDVRAGQVGLFGGE